MRTSDDILREAAKKLKDAGVPSFRLDARLLLSAAMGGQDMFSATPVSEDAERRFDAFLQRRLSGEPVSRILGAREFWSMEFGLSPETLDPRPDSETVVELALEWAKTRPGPLTIWDAGTGTGCLLLALLSELPQATGIGSDMSQEALETAQGNAARLGFANRTAFVRGNWLAPARDASIDLFISNPPYIPAQDIAGLSREVRLFDPAAALVGGDDGLDAYRAIARDLPRILAPHGAAFFEFGKGQEDAVAAIMEKAGLAVVSRRADLAGITRAMAVAFPVDKVSEPG